VVTMDLIRCRVCGEPLYTPDFQQKVYDTAHLDSEPLCAQHRQRQAASKLPPALAQSSKSGDGTCA
jgi:hypothetical protein